MKMFEEDYYITTYYERSLKHYVINKSASQEMDKRTKAMAEKNEVRRCFDPLPRRRPKLGDTHYRA